MTGVIKIEIIESSQELLRYLKSAPDRDVKERVQALYWLLYPSSRKCRCHSIFNW
jgi:hypothetical protein